MSETVEITGDLDAVRRPRQRPQREMSPEPLTLTIGEPDPDAGQEAQQSNARDDEVAAANEATRRALLERDAATERANRIAARAAQTEQHTRGQVLAAEVEAATAAQAHAKQALKAAREVGDIEAESNALESLAAAAARLHSANDELQRARAGEPTSAAGNTAPPQSTPQQGGYSPAIQAWIARHPRFRSDDAYRGKMLQAHEQLARDGFVVEGPAYFRELDRIASELEGGSQGAQRNNMERDPPRREFSGAPPSRGGDGGGGNRNVVQTAAGPVTVTRRGGKVTNVQADPAVAAVLSEYARISGYTEDNGRTVADYALELVRQADEQAAGREIIVTSEGRIYR